MNKLKYFVFLFIGTIVIAQKQPLNLQQTLEIGLSTSKELKLSESALEIESAKYSEVNSNLYPQLSVGMRYNYLSQIPIQFNLPLASTSVDPAYLVYMNATIEQPLFMGFRLLSLKNAAEYRKEAAIVQNSDAMNNKALQIHISFWNFYKTKKMVEVLSENINSLENYLKDTEAFWENGLVTKNDLLKLKVRISEMQTKLIETENTYEISRAVLNKCLDKPLEEKTEIIASEFDENFNEYNFKEILEEAIQNRSDLKSNNFYLLAAEEKISAARSSWYPQIAAFGSYNYFRISGTSMLKEDWTNFWMVGLNANWNIWDWWKTASLTEQAQQQYNQTQLTNEMIKENVEIEVYSNYLFLKTEENKVHVSKLRVESAEENYRIIEDKFNNQLATSSELVDANNEMLEAKTTLITSFINYKIAKIKLEKSLGRRIY